jgi:hypothetical protein
MIETISRDFTNESVDVRGETHQIDARIARVPF